MLSNREKFTAAGSLPASAISLPLPKILILTSLAPVLLKSRVERSKSTDTIFAKLALMFYEVGLL
jgi:hypothetical protein